MVLGAIHRRQGGVDPQEKNQVSKPLCSEGKVYCILRCTAQCTVHCHNCMKSANSLSWHSQEISMGSEALATPIKKLTLLNSDTCYGWFESSQVKI